jgi:hypothetical protein
MNNLKETVRDEYSAEELIDGIQDTYESIREEINERYLREYGKEPEAFISSDHEEHWDYINQQREDDLDAMNQAEQKEIEKVLEDHKRVLLVFEEINQSKLEDILKDLTNPRALIEAVTRDDFCILSRNSGRYEFYSNLEDLLTIDRPISAIISWGEFRPGVQRFERIKRYAEDQIGCLYRIDEDNIRIPLYLTNIKKSQLLELVASYVQKTEDEIIEEFEDVNIFKDDENNSATICFNGCIYPFIFEKFDQFKFDSKIDLTKKLNTGIGLCELFIDTLQYHVISPAEINSDLVGKFYDFIFDWVIKNKIKLENIGSHADLEPQLWSSLQSNFGKIILDK